MFNKIFKSFLRLFFTVKFFEFRKARSNYSKHSRNVVLIYPDKWKNLLQYLYSDAIVSDLALIQAVSFLKEDYKIKFGLKNMSSIVDSQVFYNISGRFNISGYRNYTNSILQFLDHIQFKSTLVQSNF